MIWNPGIHNHYHTCPPSHTFRYQLSSQLTHVFLYYPFIISYITLPSTSFNQTSVMKKSAYHLLQCCIIYKYVQINTLVRLTIFNPLKPELNPICYLLALLGVHHFLHVSRIRVKLLTFRLLMSYIYMEHPFLMFLDHTQRRSTVGRTPLGE